MTISELKRLKKDFYVYFDEQKSLEAVKQDGDALKYVNENIIDMRG